MEIDKDDDDDDDERWGFETLSFERERILDWKEKRESLCLDLTRDLNGKSCFPACVLVGETGAERCFSVFCPFEPKEE